MANIKSSKKAIKQIAKTTANNHELKARVKNTIKAYIESINSITSLHIPNLITEITNKYRESIVFFEFIDMNGYGPSVQHIYSMDMPENVITPEFLNVAALPDGTPDINIILA